MHFIPQKEKIAANDIYSQSLYNVVEVKAESENVGESFGTGEIISKDGRIITNAHVVTYTRLGSVKEFDHYFIRFAFEDDYRVVKLEKYDSELDIAVLYFEEKIDIDLQPIKIGDSTLKLNTESNFEALNIRCVLLVGNYSSLSKAERKCFEIYRNELRSIEIICFDELLAKINLMLDLFEDRKLSKSNTNDELPF